jgi:hypothetical protein
MTAGGGSSSASIQDRFSPDDHEDAESEADLHRIWASEPPRSWT